jgi:exonuclease III
MELIDFIYDTDVLDYKEYTSDYKGKKVYIVHQCNCTSYSGRGLYSHIAKIYPQSDIYKNKQYKRKPDTIKIIGITKNEGSRTVNVELNIVCMFSQYNPGLPQGQETFKSREITFQKCLNLLSQELSTINNAIVVFPFKIGCGLAGGN